MEDKKGDFDWTNDVSSDYWDYHNVLVFNDTISYEEFDDLISYALYSKEPKNWDRWDDDGRKEAWNYLTHLVRNYGMGYLIWDNPYLAVSAEVSENLKNPKLVNYKDIVNQKPKLDESDDFNWVKDEVDKPIRFSIGDKIRVINVGDVETFINFLGTAGVYYRKGMFGTNLEGEIIEGGDEHMFALKEKNMGKVVFLPWLDKVDYWVDSYPNLNVKYEFIDDDLNESNDLDWIKDVEPPNLNFSFDGKEHWVDVSKIDREGRKKIVNYIKKVVPNYEEFEGDLFDHISRGNYKGIIVHCGSDRTDYEPEENLLCSAHSSYEDDYKIDNPHSDMMKSVYLDGQEILDYMTMDTDDEELDESLEWSDKDVPFDEKDKSFESDPSWKDDEDWSLNPERSYWKQGDTGGSGGGDVNESDEFEWISNTRPILKDLFDENLIGVGDILTLYGTLDDDDGEREQQVDDFKVKIDTVSNSEKPKLVSTYFIPLQKKYWGFLGYDGTGNVRFLKKDGNLQLVDRISGKDLVEESNEWDWVKDVKPNWGTYYGGVIMKDIEGLPKNLEDVTSEMLSPIWMKIETINRQILTRKNRDTEHDVSETLFESMGQIEWLFGRIMALVDGETDSLVSSRMEPQEYYNSRKLSIISHIKGMTEQLELLGESKDVDWGWAEDVSADRKDSKYYLINKESNSNWSEQNLGDEWFMIEVVDRDEFTVSWRAYAFNVANISSWQPSLEISKMSTDEFNNLVGVDKDGNHIKIPYWQAHDGDLSDLPKNHEFRVMSQLNESDITNDFNWVKKISSDDYEPNTGDHIEIVNQGDSHLFKNWLSPSIWMDYKMGRISNSDGNIEGVVQNIFPSQDEKDNFVVKIKGTKNEYIFLPKRYKIKQIKEKSRDPEWYGLDIVYKPIVLRSELKEDSSDSSDWLWTKDIKPKFTKITSNIYQYGDGSLPRIKVVFKRVENGEIKTTVIEFDDYEFLDNKEYMNRHFILMGVDEDDNDWLVDGIAYSMGGGEYEWDVNWESLENNS